ncbi:MAG: carbohydrate ABC transporter permease, partial [Clostridia bacterium]
MNRELKPASKALVYTVLVIICFICVIPIIAVVSISFSTDLTIAKEGYSIFPKDFTTDAYRYVFTDSASILRSYGVSLFVTLVGCALGLTLNALMAYVLSRPDYRHRGKLTVFLTIPMVLNGGLIPTYILLTRYLHLKNTLAVMILPMLVVPRFIILMRKVFSQIH